MCVVSRSQVWRVCVCGQGPCWPDSGGAGGIWTFGRHVNKRRRRQRWPSHSGLTHGLTRRSAVGEERHVDGVAEHAHVAQRRLERDRGERVDEEAAHGERGGGDQEGRGKPAREGRAMALGAEAVAWARGG